MYMLPWKHHALQITISLISLSISYFLKGGAEYRKYRKVSNKGATKKLILISKLALN